MMKGMTCSGCERTVEKIITNLKGIKSAEEDRSSASVSLNMILHRLISIN